MQALSIRGGNNDSSSTHISTGDDSKVDGRSMLTKQALIYDKEHNLVTMLQEVTEGESYFVEIIDSGLMKINHLSSSPLLPPGYDSSQGGGSDRDGSYSGSGRLSSSGAHQPGSFSAAARGSVSHHSMSGNSGGRNLSYATDMDDYARSRSDLAGLEEFAQRQTRFKVALVGQA